MPRKPKAPEKQTIQVTVNGKAVNITLHPPTKARRSWYAYWNGLVASKSTGQSKLEDARVAAEEMVRNGGKKATVADAVLSDEEFDAIQRRHFSKKTDPAAKIRAQKTLEDCLDAISAFRDISGLKPVTIATPDDCERFQQEALKKPKNWRKQYPKSKKDADTLSANTVLKWSRSLQAAFDRANRNAGRKSVRGLVDSSKLLNENPWKQFTWIYGTKRPIRQFDGPELISLLDFSEKRWPGVPVVQAVAKVCLWSWCRRAEVMGLTWTALRTVGNEHHFEVIGKWGIEKWFRIPEDLYQELLKMKTDSPFVFGAYCQQLREFYLGVNRPRQAANVALAYKPDNLGDWFHEQIVAWSKSQPKGRATTHVFRKTSLQYARSGEDLNRSVASDARLSEGVMMTNYVKETDEQMRAKSNRMYRRIIESLEPEVARRYGGGEDHVDPLKESLKQAVAAEDWEKVAALTAGLTRKKRRHKTG
jgi:integrase